MPIDPVHPPAGATVELYVKPGCPYCAQAIAHYEDCTIPFVRLDAQNDPAHRAAMLRYTGGDPTVPAIVIDGVYVQSGWGSPPHG